MEPLESIKEPVRKAAALKLLLSAVVGTISLVVGLKPEIAGSLTILVGAVSAIYDAFYVREQVTPNESVTKLAHDTIVALAPLAPRPDQS